MRKVALKEPGCSKEEKEKLDIDNLWERYLQGREGGNGEFYRNQLMEFYGPLVRYVAERLHSRLSDNAELDELVSSGVFGLIEAIEKFDSNKHVKFETYANHIIRGRILDYLRSTDWVPRLVRLRSHQLEKAESRLEAELGHKSTDKELIKELSKKEYLDLERHRGIKKAKIIINEARNVPKTVSLFNNEYPYREDTEGLSEIDCIKNKKSSNPLYEAQKNSLKEILTKGLTRGERLIIILYYYERMEMWKIGKILELSESRVSQMHSSIIDRIKSQLIQRGLTSENYHEQLI